MEEASKGRKLKDWIKSYIIHSRHSESPEIMHFWTAVVTMAGALQRQVWIDQLYFQWTPNFYVVMVGPPGVVAKSTVSRMGFGLLKHVQGVSFGPQSMSWQSLIPALQDSSKGVSINGVLYPMSCLTCFISELGTFLKPQDEEQTSAFIALWDGQVEQFERWTLAHGQQVIENPWVNLIGCTTPSWIDRNVPENMIDGGLASRIVFVYADTKRSFVAYPSMEVDRKEYQKEKDDLIADLKLISKLKGEYKLTPEAAAWGVDWYKTHWTVRPKHLASDRFGGYLARKQTHLHKLAMILAASKSETLTITKEDLEQAETFITRTEADMGKVFQSVGVAPSARQSNTMLSFLRTYGKMSRRELWKKCLTTMTPRDFETAIEAGKTAGYLTQSTNDNKVWYQSTGAKE